MSAKQKLTPLDYKSDIKPVWCAGCGNYGNLTAMTQALAELEIDPNKLMVTSGIGCASRFPYFLNAYSLHGVHGRALPTAVGMKAARPELEVIVVGGDGDGFSIGIGHVPHVARKNVDIAYLVSNNSIYGLTKGQTSPLSAIGQKTTTSPMGVSDPPMQPAMFLISVGATFVARGYAGNPKQLKELIVRAIEHPGFAVVESLCPCPTFNKEMTFKSLSEKIIPIPEDHDRTDRMAAMQLASETEKMHVGVFYEVRKPTYNEYKLKVEKDSNPFKYDKQGIRTLFDAMA